MIKFICKYGAIIFLINCILNEYAITLLPNVIIINYILSGFGFLLLVIYGNSIFSRASLKYFRVIFLILILNFIYLITFGIETFSLENLQYLLFKQGSLILIIVGVLANPNYFNSRYLNKYIFLMSILLIVGFFINRIDIQTSRISLGFNNSNLMGFLSAIGFGVALLKDKTTKWLNILFLILFLLAVLGSGSRISILILVLATIIKFRVKFYYYILFLLLLSVAIKTPFLNNNNNALSRIIETFDNSDGKIRTGREAEFQFAILRLKSNLLAGNGFMSYKNLNSSSYITKKSDTVHGSHNAYLTIGIVYGVFFWFYFYINNNIIIS